MPPGVKSKHDTNLPSDGDQSSSDAEMFCSGQQTLEFKGQLVRKFTLKAFNEIIQACRVFLLSQFNLDSIIKTFVYKELFIIIMMIGVKVINE